MSESRDDLLSRILGFAARDGLADRSLREIAAGAGTSHRMLLYHFSSREGLLAAVVGAMEERQRAAMTALAETAGTPGELMTGVWRAVSSPEARPFVRLFFEVFALAARGAAPGPPGLTTSWLADAEKAGERLGVETDPAMLRLGVAVSRGLLIDLLAGEDPGEVDAAHDLFVRLAGQAPPPAAEQGR
ncbi:TetR/AcrR family transcriptional regulator [Actinoplanes sp. GCM10030250]|uniref:TetR/AcrR family transcriptional regulator n=1 Tax=Actinoplanes sp. GCM10030250 TaxID=3273376 RepID=UPI00360748BB